MAVEKIPRMEKNEMYITNRLKIDYNYIKILKMNTKSYII